MSLQFFFSAVKKNEQINLSGTFIFNFLVSTQTIKLTNELLHLIFVCDTQAVSKQQNRFFFAKTNNRDVQILYTIGQSKNKSPSPYYFET